MPDKPKSDWQNLYRTLPPEVYESWQEVERKVAARFGITLADKRSKEGIAGYTKVYEALTQHFLQMSIDNWENF